MIKVEFTEQIKGIYDNTNIDCDRYTIEVSTTMATKEYSVVVDFVNEEVTGDCIAYGLWFDIETENCIELLEFVYDSNQPKRYFQHIIEKLGY